MIRLNLFVSLQIILMKVFSGLGLSCHQGEYQIGNECCPNCLAGKNQLNDVCMCFLSTHVGCTVKKKKFDFLLLFSSGNRVKSHCTVESSTSCLPCMTGTYTDQPNGLERCHHCTNCDSGTFMFTSSFPDTESDLNRVILLLIVVNLKSNQDIKGCLCSLIQIFNMMMSHLS